MEGNFVSKYFKAPTENYVQTTLNGSITDSDTSIILTDASKLQAPGYIVVDRIDANGNSTPASREVIYFTSKVSNTIGGCTRGADGSTAQSHSDGARVETMPTVGMWNDLVNIVSTAILETGDGIAVSTATITGSLNVTGATLVGIDLQNFNAINVTGVSTFQNIAVTSLASIAQVESNLVRGNQAIFTSVASINTVGANRIEYQVAKMSLDSSASIGSVIDFDVANLFTRSLSTQNTATLSNWSTGDKAIVRLTQAVTGATVAWSVASGSTIAWIDGVSPTLTTTPNKTDVFGFLGVSDTQLDGYVVGQGI